VYSGNDALNLSNNKTYLLAIIEEDICENSHVAIQCRAMGLMLTHMTESQSQALQEMLVQNPDMNIFLIRKEKRCV
jgi:signal transduction protein with GAF and PtsI domain